MSVLKPWVRLAVIIAAISAACLWLLSQPSGRVTSEAVSAIQANIANGQQVFTVAGCGSCHVAPAAQPNGDVTQHNLAERPLLSGGQHFITAFGTFVAPNISPDKVAGIGRWSDADFATALLKGLSPDNQHYYPVFPYTAYTRMTLQDVIDLKAFLDTLPASSHTNTTHELHFPWNIRRGIGLWKRRYLTNNPALRLVNPTVQQQRGQYLVEALGHCGECHSPRNRAGATETDQWLAGSADINGQGGKQALSAPNITSHQAGLATWSAEDIADYLSTGFTPDYDVAGGLMSEVINNTRQLSKQDRLAMGEYLKVIPHRNGDGATD